MKAIYKSKYSNSWALVLGINKYKYAPPLGYATNDANAVRKLLTDRFAFPVDNISLLLDENATRDAIRGAFMNYAEAQKVQPDDRLLVFFAGHGHTVSGKRGEVGFLVPADGKPEDLNTLIRWDELTRNADLIPAKHIFFLMDACYGGLALMRSPAFGSMRFMGDMLQRYARQVLTAGKADETVADGNGVRPGHSIFTAHLLNALEGAAATEEGVITANGVMAYVYDRVGRDQYSHQTPHYGFVDGDGDFIFDTAILDRLRAASTPSASDKDKGAAKGEPDILVNTSPQVITGADVKAPVVDTMKELLSDPTKKIKLDDFVSMHVRRFLDTTDLRHFLVQGAPVTQDAFIERTKRYEDASKDLQQIVILLARWGEGDQLLLLEKVFTRLAEADKGSSGTVIWLRLTWYPVLLLMYSAGISALASRKYDALRIIFQTSIQTQFERGRHPIIVPTINNLTELHDTFKWLPGHERHYAPRSEYFFKTLQPILEDMLLLGRSYESLFDEFEVLLALDYASVDGHGHGWGPPGRFAWKVKWHEQNPFSQLINDAKKKRNDWAPLRAGLFSGSIDEFLKTVDEYQKLLAQLNWH